MKGNKGAVSKKWICPFLSLFQLYLSFLPVSLKKPLIFHRTQYLYKSAPIQYPYQPYPVLPAHGNNERLHITNVYEHTYPQLNVTLTYPRALCANFQAIMKNYASLF